MWDRFLNLVSRGQDRLWWLKMILPAMLGISLILAFTHFLYVGEKPVRLASLAESRFIEFSLDQAPYEAVNRQHIHIISLTDGNLSVLPQAPSRFVRDAAIDVYAQILEKVGNQRPKLIILDWLPVAHKLEARYLDPIIKAAGRLASDTKLIIPLPLTEIPDVPEALKKYALIAEGDNCGHLVQTHCTYKRSWNRWIMQILADTFWYTEHSNIPEYHITTNLPHTRPNYLLNLPDVKSMNEHNFMDLLTQSKPPPDLAGKSVFIGSRVTQNPKLKGDEILLQRTFIPGANKALGLEKEGTPYHIIWALTAQMFLDRKTVAIAPRSITLIVMAMLAVCIVFLLAKIGAAGALGIFLVYTFFYPVINSIAIAKFQFYLPVFDIVYAGGVTFLLSAFAKISYQSFQLWKLEAMEKAFRRSADLKGNFISLISHNLNTPIAKIQGLVNVMKPLSSNNQIISQSLAHIDRSSSKLLLCVRSVLLTTTIDENAIQNIPVKIARLIDEFIDTFEKLLKVKIGVNYEISLETDDHDSINVDKRAFIHMLASLIALHETKDDHSPFNKVAVTISTDSASNELFIHAKSSNPEDSRRVGELFSQSPSNHSRIIQEDRSFYETVLVRLIESFLTMYSGKLELKPSKGMVMISLKKA